MIKPIAIILGEPNSISSEIIFKSWIKKKIQTLSMFGYWKLQSSIQTLKIF